MELIHYADGSVLTGTEIARALVAYARVLAAHGTAATVDIPIREQDGTVGRANFLLGPASQIVSVSVESDLDELRDEALVLSLRSETRKQSNHEVRADEQGADVVPEALELDEFEPPTSSQDESG